MQNRFVLVSFCNLPQASASPLLCLKVPLKKKEPVYYKPVSPGDLQPINSATGIAINSGRIFVLFYMDGTFYLAGLRSSDLSPFFVQELKEVKDGHSILASDNKLYIVSTGTDEILQYDLNENGVGNPECYWRAAESGIDTHHVNSITKTGEDLFVTAFGAKTGALWSSASNGYIHNITRDIRVMDGIYHPHSLSQWNGALYYCDSSRKAFCSLDGPLFELEGYTRGVGWLSDELVCIASSVGRRISKSTGLIANPADPGAVMGKSKLSVRNIKTGEAVADVNLSRFGPEIYDILALEEEFDLSTFKRLSW